MMNRDGFRHVQHVRPNRGPTKKRPHRPENVGQQREILWPVRASLWRVATSKRSPGAVRHSLALYAVMRNLKRTTLLSTHLFPEQKIYVSAPRFFAEQVPIGFKSGPDDDATGAAAADGSSDVVTSLTTAAEGAGTTSRCRCRASREAAVMSFMASTGSRTRPQAPAASQLAGLATEPLIPTLPVMLLLLLMLLMSAVDEDAAITFAAVPADITAVETETETSAYQKTQTAI